MVEREYLWLRLPFMNGLLIDVSFGACRHPAARGGYGNGNTSSAVGTGTGGYDTQAPHPATDEHHTYASGRGGAGNIHSDY
jgi:hypothetical protein